MSKEHVSRDRIIELAQKAGFIFHNETSKTVMYTVPLEYSEKYFERFATLIVEANACNGITNSTVETKHIYQIYTVVNRANTRRVIPMTFTIHNLVSQMATKLLSGF